MNKHFRQAIILTGILISSAATAATETTTIDVTASVAGSCTVNSDPLTFGDVESGSETNASGAVTVNCSNGIVYRVGMNEGQHVQNGERAMTNPGGDFILYRIFKSPENIEWGDGSIGGSFPHAIVNGTGNGLDQTLDFLGVANPSGVFPVGSFTAGTDYSDVVTVTVQF